MTTITLSEQEAVAFRAFREQQDAIEIMLKAGVFDIRRGSVEIHFDLEGKIGAIVGHSAMFKRDQVLVIAG